MSLGEKLGSVAGALDEFPELQSLVASATPETALGIAARLPSPAAAALVQWALKNLKQKWDEEWYREFIQSLDILNRHSPALKKVPVTTTPKNGM